MLPQGGVAVCLGLGRNTACVGASGHWRRPGADAPALKEEGKELKGWEPCCSQGRKCQGWVAGLDPCMVCEESGRKEQAGEDRWVFGPSVFDARLSASPLCLTSCGLCACIAPMVPVCPPVPRCVPLGAAVKRRPMVSAAPALPTAGSGRRTATDFARNRGAVCWMSAEHAVLAGQGRTARSHGGAGRVPGTGVCAWWRPRDRARCGGDGHAGS